MMIHTAISKVFARVSLNKIQCNKSIFLSLIAVFFIALGIRTVLFGQSYKSAWASSSVVLKTESSIIEHTRSEMSKNEAILKALSAISKGKWDNGRDIIANARDPFGSRLFTWLQLMRDTDNQSITNIAQFIRNNNDWPQTWLLRNRLEEMFPDNAPNSEIIAWFDDYPPRTSEGLLKYVSALVGSGKRKQAQEIIAERWANAELSRDGQRRFYGRYKDLISRDAHVARLDVLLHDRQYKNALGIAGVLGADYVALAEARIALASNGSDVDGLIRAVPTNLRNDPGLQYERLRWRRRARMNDRAIEILDSPPSAASISNKDDWWRERHIIIRRLIEEKSYKKAYKLASTHIQDDGFSYAQAEWLSGWLALRFLGDAEVGLHHFEAMYAKVSTPVSRSRGAYWIGRAFEDMGAADMAEQWYETAAGYSTTFYGQVAAKTMGKDYFLPKAALPDLSPEEIRKFRRDYFLRAAELLHVAGFDKESSLFFKVFIKKHHNAKGYLMAAQTAIDIGLNHEAVSISKKATQEGLFLTAQSYPVLDKKIYGRLNVDPALVHALIRQESLFNPQARSHAGALGLMQLMPGTAKMMARKAKVRYNVNALISDPQYNVRLGGEYMREMLQRYDGNHIMAIAAYNAGPGRVDNWLKEFGDPRIGQRDLIDWIELIPIYETRNYVQRVTENRTIYGLRLNL